MIRITLQENADLIEMSLEGHVVGRLVAELSRTWLTAAPRMGKRMLRITIHEDDETIGMMLEGRIAGPWVAELSRAWLETSPRLGDRKLSLDLRNVTYSDTGGKQVLREIYAQTNAELIAGSIWAEYLAEEITKTNRDNEEPGHGYDS
jgi:hypothetical protein